MIWLSCHQQGLSTKLPPMISVFKRSQIREKRYQKEGKNYQTIPIEVLTHAIQKKLHGPHKQNKNHKRSKMLEKLIILILMLWFQMISNVIL